MKRIAIVNDNGINKPAEPFPANAISIRGDLEPGYYLCFQPGDELPPPVVIETAQEN